MKILLLGGTGFIGGAVLARLLERGDTVHALARDDAGALGLEARGAKVFRGDLGDPQAIATAAKGTRRGINAAGIVSPRAAERALRWTHVAGTENVVNACRHSGVARLVHVSCGDVTLENMDRIHWDEEKHLGGRPFGARAQALQLAEEIAMSASDSELEVAVVRGAWVWGPGDTSRLPGLCSEGLSGGIRLVGDGRTYLATTYIDHLVDAILSALEATEAPGRAFMAVDPVFQHTRDFFTALSDALGLPPPRTGAPFALAWPLARVRGRGPGGCTLDEMLQRGKSTLFDFNSTIGKLGYDPKVSLDEGLAALAAWVEAKGGPAAVASLAKPPPDARSVDAMVHAAGGD
jgi:nucleoside-diphosphate-sugar epimerase